MFDDDLAQALARAFGGLANRVSNQALKMDAATTAKLQQLAGRVIEIQCQDPAASSSPHSALTWHVTIGPIESGQSIDPANESTEPEAGTGTGTGSGTGTGTHNEALTVTAGPHDAPHAIVAAPAHELLTWLFTGTADKLQISGDATLLMDLAAIGQAYSPDFAAPLEGFLGPEVADKVTGTAELGIASAASLLEGLRESIKTHSRDSFVARDPFDAFLSQVDELRLRVDRLAARVSRHEQNNRKGKSR